MVDALQGISSDPFLSVALGREGLSRGTSPAVHRAFLRAHFVIDSKPSLTYAEVILKISGCVFCPVLFVHASGVLKDSLLSRGTFTVANISSHSLLWTLLSPETEERTPLCSQLQEGVFPTLTPDVCSRDCPRWVK